VIVAVARRSIMIAAESGGLFDTINGLPVHPLVVHAAVVLIPLAAIGVLVMVFWPRFSRSFGIAVVVTAALATGAAFVAKEAGEALASRVGEPGFDHQELGDVMPIVAGVLLLAAIGLWLIDRRTESGASGSTRWVRIAVAALAAVIAVGNLVWIYRVGDSGARSVWAGQIAGSPQTNGDTDD
jgi:uncharacterized membrane protein